MPKKKPTRKRNPRRKVVRRATVSGFNPWVQRRVVVSDDEVWEIPSRTAICISCYTSFEYDYDVRFDIRNKFCTNCRRALPFKKWLLVRKFHRVLEEALNRREPEKEITRGSVMQFVNGCYQSILNNMSREFLLDTMSCTVDIGHLATPIELSQLMEIYDQVVTPKKKSRIVKKKRRRGKQ